MVNLNPCIKGVVQYFVAMIIACMSLVPVLWIMSISEVDVYDTSMNNNDFLIEFVDTRETMATTTIIQDKRTKKPTQSPKPPNIQTSNAYRHRLGDVKPAVIDMNHRKNERVDVFDANTLWRPKKSIDSPRYIVYNGNSGRMFNQLWTLVTAISLAVPTNRTVFVQQPDRVYRYLGMEGKPNTWLLDRKRLQERFSIVFEEEIIDQYGSVEAHPILGRNLSMLESYKSGLRLRYHHKDCKLTEDVVKLEYVKELNHCDVVHIGGEWSVRYCDYNCKSFIRHDGTMKWLLEYIWQSIQPMPYIKQAAKRFLVQHGHPKGTIPLSIHARIMNENRANSPKPEPHPLCLSRISGLYMDFVRTFGPRHVVIAGNDTNIIQHVCFPTIAKVKETLEYWHHKPILNMGKNTFICGDQQAHKLIIPEWKKAGALTAKTHKFLDDTKRYQNVRKTYSRYNSRVNTNLRVKFNDFPRTLEYYRSMQALLFDLELVKSSEFFFGNPYSSIVQALCFQRGFARMNTSNACVSTLPTPN